VEGWVELDAGVKALAEKDGSYALQYEVFFLGEPEMIPLTHDAALAFARLLPEVQALMEALKPLGYLAQVMNEDTVFCYQGVYLTYEQAKAAQAALAAMEEDDG